MIFSCEAGILAIFTYLTYGVCSHILYHMRPIGPSSEDLRLVMRL